MFLRNKITFALGLTLAVVAFILAPQAQEAEFSPYVGADGTLSVPEGYRDNLVFIGTWAIDNKDGAGIAGIHNVYTNAEAVAHFRETGEWQDGAVIVKELLEVNSGKLTTGQVSWGAEVSGWFVMVKDSKGRFPDNRLWGNGWGWAFFNPDDPKNTISTNFRADCLGCHIPARGTDWIFIDGYQSLSSKE
jgi:hypothetical protein